MWPDDMDFKNAYYWGPLGIDYEFGVLENETRTAIQMVHRIGALVVTAAIIAFSFALRNYKALRKSVLIVLALLTIQVALGIINVVMSLPMFAATMHNVDWACAALKSCEPCSQNVHKRKCSSKLIAIFVRSYYDKKYSNLSSYSCSHY